MDSVTTQDPVQTAAQLREQLLQLLGQGLEVTDVLKLTSTTQATLGEYLADKEFTSELRGRRAAHKQEIVEEKYATLELKTLGSLAKDVENDGLLSVAEKTRILETVSKNRVLYRNPAGHYTNPTAHLTIEVKVPQDAASRGVTIDQSTGQILAIGDRSMAAMPIQGVRKIFSELEASDKGKTTAQKIKEVVDADLDLEDTAALLHDNEHDFQDEGAAANDYSAKEQAASFA